jgi:hypothetical protein
MMLLFSVQYTFNPQKSKMNLDRRQACYCTIAKLA